MILATDDLKEVCNKILVAVDTSEISKITETLEMIVVDQNLYISVTNREYYVQVRIYLGYDESFHATVNASLFLKLISKITTEDISLEVKDNYLQCKGNGMYKIPLIFDGDKLLELPFIEIVNPTCEMFVEGSILKSILKYNSKELSKGIITHPVQKQFYVDEQGAITFTTGACVNSFTLEKPVRLLINSKVVKLFKLFPDDEVRFTLGYDAISDKLIQTKVRFESSDIILTAILSCDDTLLNSVPVKIIRNRADNIYPYSINISKEAFLQAVNRLLIFDNTGNIAQSIGFFEFEKDTVTIYDKFKVNSEVLSYADTCAALEDSYKAKINLNDLKTTLETCNDQYLTLSFGDGKALVFSKANVKFVIPECNPD